VNASSAAGASGGGPGAPSAAPTVEACAGTECCGESPTHVEIAALAHEIWETRGRPLGQDLDIWLAAEIEVRSRSG
jgi:hypothetical protein